MPDFCTFGREMLLQRRLCDEERLPHHAYLPFGDGPRICIGNHFALMERQLILATLVQHVTFDLLARQRIEPEPLVTLRPRHGIKVIVERS
jgi:cytochrome P450